MFWVGKKLFEDHTWQCSKICFGWMQSFFFFFWLFGFLAFLGPYPWHMEVPRPGSNRSCSCRPMPQPQQCQIHTTSATYTTAHGNARSSTHWARPGIKPATSWFLVRFANHWATTGTTVFFFCFCFWFFFFFLVDAVINPYVFLGHRGKHLICIDLPSLS